MTPIPGMAVLLPRVPYMLLNTLFPRPAVLYPLGLLSALTAQGAVKSAYARPGAVSSAGMRVLAPLTVAIPLAAWIDAGGSSGGWVTLAYVVLIGLAHQCYLRSSLLAPLQALPVIRRKGGRAAGRGVLGAARERLLAGSVRACAASRSGWVRRMAGVGPAGVARRHRRLRDCAARRVSRAVALGASASPVVTPAQAATARPGTAGQSGCEVDPHDLYFPAGVGLLGEPSPAQPGVEGGSRG